jgi:hydrogenase-4 component E
MTNETALRLLGAALIMTSFWMLGGRRIISYLFAYAAQSLVVAAVALVVAIATHDINLYIVAGLTVVVKVLIVTQLLRAVERRLHAKHEIEPLWGKPISLLIGIVLIVFAFAISPKVVAPGTFLDEPPLAISIAVVLMGLYLLSTRRHVVTQIVGLLTLENGLFTGAIAIAYGMPLIIEFGILFDVLIATVVLVLLVSLIQRELVSADTGELRRLRG